MTQVLREVRLYGDLARFGRVFRLAVETVAEAVCALRVMLPGFEQMLLQAGAEYRVRVGRTSVSESDLALPVGTREVIRIVPVVEGRKRQGLGQVIAGAVLVVAGVAISGMSYGWAAPVGEALVSAGVAMAVGGVVQMISPQRGADGSEKSPNQPSYGFNGATNIDSEGGCVPVLYGEMIVGSVVISGGIRTADIAA